MNVENYRPEWRGLALALLIALPLYIFGTFGHDLWRPAEAREAGIARAMLENGNWVVTYLNDQLFLEKPPLYTWALALPLKLLGYHDWVVRIPVFLFTLGTLALTFVLARQRLGIVGAQGTVVSLASMSLFMEVNHGAMIDNGLVFFVLLALTAFWRMTSSARGLVWPFLFYLALGLTFLCKGAIGVLLILVVAGGFSLTHKSWHWLWSWRRTVFGLLIFSGIVGSWLLALWLKGGRHYYHVFFYVNHVQRFLGQEGPTRAWHYYFPLVFAAIAPWLLILPAAWREVWRQRKAGDPITRCFWNYIFWWIGGMFILLSLPRGKNNQYLLPLLPAFAVMCGTWVECFFNRQSCARWQFMLSGVFVVIIILAAVAAPLTPMFFHHRFQLGSVVWCVIMLLAGCWITRALFRDARRQVVLGVAFLFIGLGLSLGLFIEKPLNESKSMKPLANALHSVLSPEIEFWGYDLNENTEGALIFYGLPPRRMAASEAESLAYNSRPLAVLLASESHSDQHPFKDQMLEMNAWHMLLKTKVGGRVYWLLGNATASGSGRTL